MRSSLKHHFKGLLSFYQIKKFRQWIFSLIQTIQGAHFFTTTFEKQDTTKQKKIVLDLFSGVGVFGLTVAHKIPNISKVIGYEIVKEAVMDANENAIMNNLSDKCKFYVRELTKPGPLDGLEDKDDVTSEDADSVIEAVIVDPARPGCSKDILREIRTLRPKRIVYISCNPDTQARDASILFGNDDDDKDGVSSLPTYRLTSIKPCDMFPHALHVETVAVFDLF